MKFLGLLLTAMLAIGAAAPKTERQTKAEFNEPEGFSVYRWGTPPEVITGIIWPIPTAGAVRSGLT